MEISVAVMTHPNRRRLAGELEARLPGLPVRRAEDPDPWAPAATARTATLAWSRTAQDASHHLVLQDDSAVCDGFAELLRRVVETRPDAAICLHADWSGTAGALGRLAVLAGRSWSPVLDELPVQALVLPRALAAGLSEHLRSEVSRWEPYDVAALAHLRSVGAEVVVAWPNLVDRVDTPSLLPNAFEATRRSCCFPPDVDHTWSSTTAGIPVALPMLTWQHGVARFVPTGAGRALPAGRAVSDLLTARGYPMATAAGELGAVLDRLPGASSLRASVGLGFLLELWLTGVAIGLIAGDVVPPAGTVRQALATVAPGGLWRYVTADALHELTDDLASLIAGGIQAGTARHDPARPLTAAELVGG